MEEVRETARYWCHGCSRVVDPIVEVQTIKCSLCHGEFVEEMDSIRSDYHHHNHHPFEGESDHDRALSLWAPILLGMMSNPRRRRRFRQLGFDEDDEDDRHDPEERFRRHHLRHHFHHQHEGEESEFERELESFIGRRMRSSATNTIFQLLQGVRAGSISESGIDTDRENGGENRERDRERERVILINPFNQTIIVQGSGSSNPFDSSNPSQNHPIGSLGDYFVGPGLELLLQHLAENDPNRYGTPPAQKEAVEAMPTVKIEESSIQCSVCLDDFEIGAEAKEMPCKHKFHSGCILPWLELHSSCPVCRYQLPSDESKLDRERGGLRGSSGNANGIVGESLNGGNSEEREDGDGEGRNGRRFSVSLPWPFSSLFSLTSGTQSANPDSSLGTSTSASSGPESGSGSGSGSSPPAQEADEGSRRENNN